MRILPPVWFLFSLIAIVLLSIFAPGAHWLDWPLRALGALPILLGNALAIWGARLFHTHKTPIVPGTTSSHLVTTGPYRFTRNPMYLGMAIALLGAATLTGAPTPFIIVPVFMAIIQTRFIHREEQMLRETFGDEYTQFCARTRRWI